MSSRSLVLVLGNDLSLAAAKTSRHLRNALERLGVNAVTRDTRLVRWAVGYLDQNCVSRREAYENAVEAKWDKFVSDYGITSVLSLDLHWLVSSRLFVASDQIRRIDSFWFDDLRSHLQTSPMFPLTPHTPLEMMNNPKVTHHCYGRGQAEELRHLGVQRIRASALAAPAEFLKTNEPCAKRDRLAFVGNPGLPTAPSREALAAMERRESLQELRRLARWEILESLPHSEPAADWIRKVPSVLDLLATATELRLAEPHTAAVTLLLRASVTHPEAFDFLNRSGLILDAALLVKLINRYDRPAVVHRLWKSGRLDVYGTPEQWVPYGITSQPTVPFPKLPQVYRQYLAHLNAANCARDATANEKLFEIAACGRLSLNLDSPDVRACYSEGEIVLADSLDTLEAAAEKVLRDPDAALAAGEKARHRTANEHLWEHRLREVIA